MAILFKAVFAACSIFVLAATPYVVWVGLKRPLEYAELDRFDGKTLIQKVWTAALLIGSLIGIGICVYRGAELLLWWIPKSWGSVDDDGVWMWTGDTFAGMAAFLSAIGLMSFFGQRSREATNERNKKLVEEYQRNKFVA